MCLYCCRCVCWPWEKEAAWPWASAVLGLCLAVRLYPSAVRAVVMACLPAGAMALRRESDSLTGLAAALLVLLLWNPMSVWMWGCSCLSAPHWG